MSQYTFPNVNPATTYPNDLANLLNNFRDAVQSGNLGVVRPTYAVPGMLWVDTAAGSTWKLKQVVSVGPPAVDAVIAVVNATTGVVTVPIESGGTGANTAAAARSALGLGALSTLATLPGSLIDIGTVTPARMAPGTPGYLLGYDSAGAVAAVPKSADIEVSRRVAQVAAGAHQVAVFRMVDGSIRAVGASASKANGDRTGNSVSFPQRIAFAEKPATPIVEVVCNGQSCFALTSAGVVYAWGDNAYGQLGIGDEPDQYIAQPIETFRENGIIIKKIIPCKVGGVLPRSSFFLTSTGRIYGCGRNSSGELGNSSTSQRDIPVRCGLLFNITSVSVSAYPHHVLAIDSSGATYGWGENSSGELGIGTTSDVSAPTLLTGLSGAVAAVVAAGGSGTDATSPIGSSFAIKSDGTLWTAGNNTYGQLGLNDTTQRTSWTQVTTLARPVTQLAVSEGRSMTCVARVAGLAGGEAWVWGDNGKGQCGTDSTTDQKIPQKPAGAWQNAVSKVATGGSAGSIGVVVQSGSDLYAVGYNTNSNLGVGDASEKHTFERVLVPYEVTISDWGTSGGTSQWGIWLLTSDGRAEVCGDNTSGQLGIRESTVRDMPFFGSVRF